MDQYHKIQTVYKRDPATKHKYLLEGEFSTPELEFLANCQWEWTEKIDGTNVRVGYVPEGMIMCGAPSQKIESLLKPSVKFDGNRGIRNDELL